MKEIESAAKVDRIFPIKIEMGYINVQHPLYEPTLLRLFEQYTALTK